MKRKKQWISMILAAVLCLSAVPVLAAFSDMPQDEQQAEAIEKLSALEVINGYDDGTFRPENYVTRAEFAKLAVAALGQEEMANQSAAGIFYDVPAGHWANGYINYVSSQNLIKGYPDGSFCPDENIPFSQVVTILIRMLGYTTEEVGYHWPRSYLEKASALGLTAGLQYAEDELMTRGSIALLLDRTLDTEINGERQKLVESTGYQLIEDVTFVADRTDDASLLADEVKTTSGDYRLLYGTPSEWVGKTGSIYLNEDDKIQYVRANVQTREDFVVESVVANEISGTQNGAAATVTLKDDTIVYQKGTGSTFDTARGMFTQGAYLNLYYDADGTLEYVMLREGEEIGPATVTAVPTSGDSVVAGIQISEGVKVFRNGLAVDITDLRVDDIIYYTPSSNILMAYAETRTGIYEEAYPSKAFVESILLSGTEYEIESTTAANKLNESPGAFGENEKITLLLGKDGKIADVKQNADLSASDLVVVLDTYSEISEEEDTKGRLEYYVRVLDAEGDTYDYKAENDFEYYIGSLVEMEFDSAGRITAMSSKHSSISGTVNQSTRYIGDTRVANDCKIIELLKNPDDAAAEARVIEWADIDVPSLTSSDVIYAEKDDEFGDITFLYLNNISNDGYQYGLLKETDTTSVGMSVSGRYTIDIAGTEYTFSLQSAYSISRGTPVGVSIVNNQLDEMFALNKIGSGDRVEATDYDRIKVDGKVYNLDPNASVYSSRGNSYERVAASINELESLDYQTVDLYSDKSLSRNGKIRVIIVR